MLKSGDADKVVYNGAGLTIHHYDISSPPGLYPQYPNGREKVRNILRLLYDPKTGNVWFGGNHGVSMYEAATNMVWEHQHTVPNGYQFPESHDAATNPLTQLTGDWPGVALDEGGDLWMGGGQRTVKLQYATQGRQFWSDLVPKDTGNGGGIDVWPDSVINNGYPDQRTDDNVTDLATAPGGIVWVGSNDNGLAQISASGIWHIPAGNMTDKSARSLELDPQDGSLWVGHQWGGLTRIQGGTFTSYSRTIFGDQLINTSVNDIQSDMLGGQRRILVGFSGGVIGIYTGK
jgi:ligand-binding sensor domain-containing protein